MMGSHDAPVDPRGTRRKSVPADARWRPAGIVRRHRLRVAPRRTDGSHEPSRCEPGGAGAWAKRTRSEPSFVEDDAELRNVTAALLEDEQLDTVECESAEAALAVMLMHERDISMIFADVRLTGAMDGVDLAWEVRQRWPTKRASSRSGLPCRT
jgi:hypothetical protein